VLADSAARWAPEADFAALLVDRPEGRFDPGAEPFEIVPVEGAGIPDFADMVFRYRQIELNTAVKPYFLRHLFNREGVDRMVYLDPDILLTGPLSPVFRALDTGKAALTPHLLSPLPEDGRKPSNLGILRSGTYNLGFFACRKCPEILAFLDWWCSVNRTECYYSVRKGIFVDQRWMEFLPSFVDDVAVLRGPGLNMAYWNLHERKLSPGDRGEYRVNGEPLRFYHFSGFDPERPNDISRYQNRFTLDKRPDLRPLFEEYARLIENAGYRETRSWPFAFRDGVVPVGLVGKVRRRWLWSVRRVFE